MISHDTQLCLAEPEEPKRWREKKKTKRGKMGGKGFTKKEKQELGPRQTNNFSCVHLSKKLHPPQSPCLSIRANVLLLQAVVMQFADVGTTGPGAKSGN